MRYFTAYLLAIFVGISPLWASTLDDDLLKSAEAGKLDVVKLLIQKGADVNARDHDGETPLMKADRAGHIKVSNFLLLEAGADPDLRNKDGLTAMDIAVGATPEMVHEKKEATARKESKPVNTSFRLKEMTIAADSLNTHKELWTAAVQAKSEDYHQLERRLMTAIAQHKALRLKPGTRVSLTGKATGIVSQVTMSGVEGAWWIPNKALKAANVPVPPDDYYRWLREEEAAQN